MRKVNFCLQLIFFSVMGFLVSGRKSIVVPSKPRITHVTHVMSDSLYVHWQPPERFKRKLTGYTLKWSNNNVTKTRIISGLLDNPMTALINELTPYTPYNIQVAAATRVGMGEFSDSFPVVTAEKVPSKPRITNVTHIMSDSLHVHWQPPERFNGILIHYTLKWSNNNVTKTRIISGHLNNPMTAFIDDLIPYTQYNIQVAASTRVGMGEFSDSLSVVTAEEVPSKPRITNVSHIMSDSLYVHWEPPERFKGILIHYTLKWSNNNVTKTRIISGHVTNPMTAFIDDLIPNTQYNIQVAAATRVGMGEFSDSFSVVTHMGADEIKLQANPIRINLMTTQNLTINCTYEPQPSVRADKRFISLILSKLSGKNGGPPEELAWIDAESKIHLFDKSPSIEVIFSGEANKENKKVYYVSGRWEKVTEDLKGEYTCTLNLLDKNGHTKVIADQLNISVAELHIKDVIKGFRNLNKQLKELQDQERTNQHLSGTDARFRDIKRKVRNLNKELKRLKGQITTNHSLSMTDPRFKAVIAEIRNLGKEIEKLKDQKAVNQFLSVADPHFKAVVKEVENLTDELQDQKAINSLLNAQLAEIKAWKDSVALSLSVLADAILNIAWSAVYENRRYIAIDYIIKDVKYADAICQIKGGYLVEVNDSEEWKFITSFLSSTEVDRSLIAGRQNGTNGQWYWPRNGQLLPYFDWTPNEATSVTESCIEILRELKWQWNVMACQKDFDVFLCEIPTVEAET